MAKSKSCAILMINHVIVDSDNVIQCDCMALRHPQGPIAEWPQNLHDVLDNGPFILYCEEWPVHSVFLILEPLAGEFP